MSADLAGPVEAAARPTDRDTIRSLVTAARTIAALERTIAQLRAELATLKAAPKETPK